MRRSIGQAVCALVAAFAASSAHAADEWWYAGEIPEKGHFYANLATMEREGAEAYFRGELIFPDDRDGLYIYEAVIECSMQDGYFAGLTHFVDRNPGTEHDVDMGTEELNKALAIACRDRAEWPTLGFQPVPDPIDDAFARNKGQ